MALFPKPSGDVQRLDLPILPPGHLIAGLMQLPMMASAKGDGEFVADFHADGARLGEPQVMRVAGLSSTDQARLGRNEVEVRPITYALWLRDRKGAFVDPTGRQIGGRRREGWSCRSLRQLPPFMGQMFADRRGLAAAVIFGRPRNRGGVIRVKAGAGLGDSCLLRGLFGLRRFAVAVELKAKRLAEGGERPFGGIGFCGFDRDIMSLAR